MTSLTSELNEEARKKGRIFELACSTETILAQLASLARLHLILLHRHPDSPAPDSPVPDSPAPAPHPESDFEMRVGPSGLIGSGSELELGLFIRGGARAGSLITLYPGTLYLPGDGSDSFLSLFIYSSIASRDRYIRHFDTSWLHHRRRVEAALERRGGSRVLTLDQMRDHLPAAVNPLGLGHFANHFPQGEELFVDYGFVGAAR